MKSASPSAPQRGAAPPNPRYPPRVVHLLPQETLPSSLASQACAVNTDDSSNFARDQLPAKKAPAGATAGATAAASSARNHPAAAAATLPPSSEIAAAEADDATLQWMDRRVAELRRDESTPVQAVAVLVVGELRVPQNQLEERLSQVRGNPRLQQALRDFGLSPDDKIDLHFYVDPTGRANVGVRDLLCMGRPSPLLLLGRAALHGVGASGHARRCFGAPSNYGVVIGQIPHVLTASQLHEILVGDLFAGTDIRVCGVQRVKQCFKVFFEDRESQRWALAFNQTLLFFENYYLRGAAYDAATAAHTRVQLVAMRLVVDAHYRELCAAGRGPPDGFPPSPDAYGQVLGKIAGLLPMTIELETNPRSGP